MSDKEKVVDKSTVSGEGVEVVGFVAQQDVDWDGDCTLRKLPMLDYQIAVMTVAQHQRITEALRGEVCRIESKWKDLYADQMELVQERDQLRAEVDRLTADLAYFPSTVRQLAADCTALRAQLAQQQVPEGYVLMPRSLTAENGAKGLLLGEFSAAIELPCPCVDDDEANEQCELCGGDGSYIQAITIEWDTIKAIYAKVVGGLAAAPAPVQAEPASPWVRVVDKHPEKGEDVLVWCYDTKEQFVAFSLGDGRFQFGIGKDGIVLACRPTHWAPLPPAPKGQQILERIDSALAKLENKK